MTWTACRPPAWAPRVPRWGSPTATARTPIPAEEEYRDNIPDNLQVSVRYEAAEEACDALSEVVDNLEDIISSLCELADA